jgi:transposase-like protein
MQRFTSQGQAQRFADTHAVIYNTRNTRRHLFSRNTPRIFRATAFAQRNTASAAQQ